MGWNGMASDVEQDGESIYQRARMSLSSRLDSLFGVESEMAPSPRTALAVSKPQPILNWLSPSTSPKSHPLLTEALTTPLPTPPPPTHHPPSFLTGTRHPPPFLASLGLARSTLPTSSLSYSLSNQTRIDPHPNSHYAQGQLLHQPYVNSTPSPYQPDSDPNHDQYNLDSIDPMPILLTNSPPGRTSIDTVRTLLERDRSRSQTQPRHSRSLSSLSSSSSSQSPSPTRALHTSPTPYSPFRNWFQGILTESDKKVQDQYTQDAADASKDAAELNLDGEGYLAPDNPIVFCHGLLGFDSVTIGPAIAPLQVTHWRGITAALQSHGAEVLITRVPATSSPVDRAKVLYEKIMDVYPGRKVHLIGHSMGGLDCRYLTSRLLPSSPFYSPPDPDPDSSTSPPASNSSNPPTDSPHSPDNPQPPSAEQLEPSQPEDSDPPNPPVPETPPKPFEVLSITTIATPHRGSSFADYFLETVGVERMPGLLGLLDMLPNGGGDGKAFSFLTLENMRLFNAQTPDVPGVRYFSWGAVYEPGLIDTWKWSHSVILEKEGPNDGLVSVESSKWGTYLGTLEHVNHLDLVGWINTARYKWAEIMGREIKFRPAAFYLGIADHVARVVEGKGKTREGDREGGAEGVKKRAQDGDGEGEGGEEDGRKSPRTVEGDRQRESMAGSLVQGGEAGSRPGSSS